MTVAVKGPRSMMVTAGLLLLLLILPTTTGWAQNTLQETGGPAEFAPGELIVRFDEARIEASPGRSTESVRRDLGLRKIQGLPLPGLELVKVPPGESVPATRGRVQRDPHVRYAEPNYVRRTTALPNDNRFGELWGLHNTGQTIDGISGTVDEDIDAPEAWDQGSGSPVVVGIIDSGVMTTHPDLVNNLWTNPGEAGELADNGKDDDGNGYVDDVHGWDFVNNDNSVYDSRESPHGTHVAGTVAAVRDNALGVAGVSEAQIMSLKFIDSDGSGLVSDQLQALAYSIDNGAKLTNNSYGGAGASQAEKDLIDEANLHGRLFVASAGNRGTDNDLFPSFPASYGSPNIISVAATNNRGDLAGFSSFGSTTVDLGAPGVDILSTFTSPQYAYMSGTSMASPHVAGAAAQIFALLPGLPHLSAKARVISSGDPLQSLAGKTVSGKRLNLLQAVTESTAVTKPPADFDGDGRTELAVYRPSIGRWFVRGQGSTDYGAGADIPVAGDYDGDDTADLALFRPSSGRWFVEGEGSTQYGVQGDLPVPGDYDGDGATDFALFRPSIARWFVHGEGSVDFGVPGDIPVPGDYDGDGATDIAVFRPSNGRWYVRGQFNLAYGTSGDIPVPGDYFGDGKADLAVFRPSTGTWFVRGSLNASFGTNGDIPVPGDYNGDGATDMAVFRPSNGRWYVRGQFNLAYGTSDDIPVGTPPAIIDRFF